MCPVSGQRFRGRVLVVIVMGLGPSVSPLYATIPPAGTVRMVIVAGSGFGRMIVAGSGALVAQDWNRIDRMSGMA